MNIDVTSLLLVTQVTRKLQLSDLSKAVLSMRKTNLTAKRKKKPNSD